MSVQPTVYQVTVALIRRGDELLLVQQQERYNIRPVWVLPGGKVELGELLHEALAREMREETGLHIHSPGTLAYIVQIENKHDHRQLVVYVFEVRQWDGELGHDDPDGCILDACFFSVEEAIARLKADYHDSRIEVEPTLAYLAGQMPQGSVWLYRNMADGKKQLVWRTP